MRSPRPRSRSLQAPITAVISCRPTYLTVVGVAPPGLSLQTRLSLWYVVYQGPRQARGNQAARRPLAGPSPLL